MGSCQCMEIKLGKCESRYAAAACCLTYTDTQRTTCTRPLNKYWGGGGGDLLDKWMDQLCV